MTLQLAVLALCGTFNPGRIRRAAPDDLLLRREAIGASVASLVVLTAGFAWMSGPILDAIDVSGPNARIAAGIGLMIVATRDLFASAPKPEPGLPGRWAGVVPMAFPVAFTPASAAITIAIGADRGVSTTVVAAAPALAIMVLIGVAPIPDPWLTWMSRSVALFASVIGVVVTLDGVQAI